MQEHRPLFVYPLIAAGVLSFAFSSILVRLAGEAPGLAVAAWRTLFTVVLVLPLSLREALPELKRFSRKEWLAITLAGIMLAGHFVTWIESLYYTTVASSTVLVTTSPIFLAVLGYLFLRDRLTGAEILAVLLGVVGAGLIGYTDAGGSSAPDPMLGNSMALTASVFVSIYMLIGRNVRQRTSWAAYVVPLYGIVAIAVTLLALARGIPLFGYSPRFYLLCGIMALGPQLLGHGAVNYALRFFPAAVIGVLTLLEPVGASTIAFFLFDEVPPLAAIAGMVTVLLAVLVMALPGILSRWPRKA